MALITLAAIGLFAAGVAAGIIGVVSMAIRREEKNITLTSTAADPVTQAGRWVNGVYVRAKRRGDAGRRSGRERHPHDALTDTASPR